ncbi:MAG: seg [Parcubacteria group bacterium]|nr:seg [Parcubacteria group bacterium]
MIMNTHTPHASQGFALLITLIFVSVILALGVSLLDVAYKQVLLSSSARQSQFAFYNADSAMECTLYFDQKKGVFRWDFPGSQGDTSLNVVCSGLDVTNYTATQGGGVRTTTYTVPCASGGISATITVLKQPSGATDIYSNGYSTCDSSASNRIERGLKVHY